MSHQYIAKDYEMQSVRRWQTGDVYAPHDLSGIEAAKWKKVRRKEKTMKMNPFSCVMCVCLGGCLEKRKGEE